ncbi:MAG: hypothetical protein AAGA33_12730 [Pseudomonadota bacterium]
MAKVIVTAKVRDAEKWEAGFRTHAALFQRQTVNRPIHFNVSTNNEVVICFEPYDLDRFFALLDSRDTEGAMEFDGVDRDSVRIVKLDKGFDPG